MGGKLTARTVATAKPGRHGDGAGLWLAVAESGARKWVFRFSFGGKVTEMGLGSLNTVTLAEARDLANAARRNVKDGVNPIAARRNAKQAKAAKPSFGQMADALIASKEPAWRNAKHRQQWRQTLSDAYVQALRPLPVDEVSTDHVLAVLQPIWLTKSETASRLRGRIEAVIDFARARGHISQAQPNPARWRGHLDHLLAKPSKLSRGHHAALNYDQVPSFLARLRERDASLAARALEFLILTGARTGEALKAQWSEVGFERGVWTVPAHRMKAGQEHRVPLVKRAMEILEDLAEGRTGEFVFPGQRPHKPLSDMSMTMVLRRMGVDVTVHGFRSAFRDWAGDKTSFPREVAEGVLAHTVGNKAEQAYRRGDALEKRRQLLEAWAQYCKPEACT
ncbi:MAG: tyrosine-type recombinase/integrase [Rhodomicrobium sp.]